MCALQPAEPGQLVGAALDGDGDRCLFIRATEHGYEVVDGDAMGAMLLQAARDETWSFAASIESDVALFGHVKSFNKGTTCLETAVGDRWLSFALRPQDGGLFNHGTCLPCAASKIRVMSFFPLRIRMLLEPEFPETALQPWLCWQRPGGDVPFNRGWKQRVSIKESHRERWHAERELFASTEAALLSSFEQLGMNAQRRRIEGEDHLLLVHASSEDGEASFGIRNSGTQAKTSLSVRLSRGVDATPFVQMLSDVQASLTRALTED